MTMPFAMYRARCPRGGTIAMELLFNLPIWLIALFAVVDFGEVFCASQQASLASRLGAEEASRTVNLASASEVPEEVLNVIGRQLSVAGMSVSCVILEHNAGQTPATLVWGTRIGNPPLTALPQCGQYVRVTVFAQTRGLLPRLLRCVGIDFSAQILKQSVTYRYAASPTGTA